MSAILAPTFGAPECVHRAQCVAAVETLAMKRGYSYTAARAIARSARDRAWLYRTPQECALAEVPTRQQSATTRGGAA